MATIFFSANARFTGMFLQSAFIVACSAQGQPPIGAVGTMPGTSPARTAGRDPASKGENVPPDASTVPGSERARAEEELKREEKQRILGVVPEFNTINSQNAATLSSVQKFQLAFKSVTDPFTFVAAGIDAGLSQWENEYPGYGQGGSGYGKRLGASYADTFDGTMIGNALFPTLLHQDPRYFRKGSGGFIRRVLYAASTTVICKGDNGRWQPNYSNLLGNVAAGGIANLYYPPADRGAGLTFERAFTVSAEGAAGAILAEFWPDVSQRLFHRPKH